MAKWSKYLGTMFVGSAAGVTLGCVIAAVVLGYSLPASARESQPAKAASAQAETSSVSTTQADGNDLYKVYLNDLLAQQATNNVLATKDLAAAIKDYVSPSL